MWRTHHKLDEAKFFLEKLNEHYHSDIQSLLTGEPMRPVFSYYLSAFISSARSITWLMRSEYGKVPGWKEWFEKQEPDGPEKRLIRVFNDLRVKTEKIEPIVPRRTFRVEDDGGPPIKHNQKLRLHMTITPVSDNPDKKVASSLEILGCSWTFQEFDGEDVVAACQEYFDHLKILVNNCERKFADSIEIARKW